MIKTEYPVVLGMPAALLLGAVAGYVVLVAIGLDRERALDYATVTVAIGGLAALRGIHRGAHRTWSFELGGLLALLAAVGALALRSISLASSRGPLFYFTVVSAGGLAFAALRLARGMTRWAARGADSQASVPRTSIETDHRVVLGMPAALLLGTAATYFLLITVGLDRELALDCATVMVAIGGLATLLGIHRLTHRTWSLEFGGLLALFFAICALALRSISLALSGGGPLFYFTIISSAGLMYGARRLMRGMTRWLVSGAAPEPAPPRDAASPE